MELRIKNLNISSGGPLIAIINKDDAKKLDLKPLDRIKIKRDGRDVIAAIDIASKASAVKKGQLGLFQELSDKLKGKEKQIIKIEVEPRPNSIQYIKNKLEGHNLTKHEVDEIIRDIIDNKLTEIEMTYFISACFTNGLNLYESAYLTEAIVESSKQLKMNKYPILDKHCVSGLPGNRTTMIIVPIIAAAGFTMIKTSTRSITSASVSYDTPILIKENKINKIVKIGPFIDNLCKNKEHIKKEKNSEYLEIKNSKYKVPIFDENFKISYKPLTGVFRHKSPDSLTHIILKGGRDVYVTEHHSLFTIENGCIISKPTNQLREDDIIIVPKRFTPENIIKEIDIAKEFIDNLTDEDLDYIFVDRVDKSLVKKFMINKNSRDHMRYYRNLIPLSLIKKEKIIIPENVTLRHADSKIIFNRKIKITKELIKLLGYYAAEGHCRKHRVEFYLGSHEKEFIKDLESCIQKVFNIKPIIKTRKTRLSETDIIMHGKLSSLIFKNILNVGNSSYEKKVPDIIFNIRKELQKIYLESYLIGDGYKRTSKNTGFAGTTVSKDLINGLQYLSTFLDVGYSTRTDKDQIRDFGKYISKCAPAHQIYLQKENITKQSMALTNQIPIIETGLYDIATNNYDILNSFNNNYKLGFKLLNQSAITFNALKRDTSHLTNYNNLKLSNIIKLANGDLAFLRIKKIEKVPYQQDWVYDLCVKGYEKFVGGNGAIFLHNSGTADTMEVLAPVSHNIEKIKQIVRKTNACMVWGGALELAAADDKLIKLERPLSLDPEGILLASILAKKLAVGSTHVLIDIPLGKNAKINDPKQAKRLKRKFKYLGKLLGMETKVIITEGLQPIGNGIGPALEARDVLSVLLNKGPEDLKKKSLMMAGILLRMAGVKNSEQAAKQILESGKAYKKMMEIIKAQGGNPNVRLEDIKLGRYKYNFKSKSNGYITEIKNKLLTKIAKIAGAPENKGAGVYLNVKIKNKIKRGQTLFTIYAENKKKLDYAINICKLNIIEIKVSPNKI